MAALWRRCGGAVAVVTVHERGSEGALDTIPLESSPKQRTRQGSACGYVTDTREKGFSCWVKP